MMESYKCFAKYYDLLTENVDYEVRSDYISNFFSRYGNGGRRVLDLACGTGTFTKILSDNGYNVTGIDLSEDMLTIAQNKSIDSAFFKANMTDFFLPEGFDFCICMLDSLNHLDSISDIKKCFKCVYDSLNENGLFIFDVNTIYKHREVLSDNTFVFDYDDFFLSWDNEYSDEERVRIILDIFVFNGKNYDRYSEDFYEKAYDVDDLKASLKGFDIIGVFDDLTENSPADNSERLYFVCKKVK